MRRAALALAVLAALLAGAWALGPREPVALAARFDTPLSAATVTAWLAGREARYPDIEPGAAKRVVWAGTPGEKRPLALVYIHGFSASAEELRPVPDEVARALGANLFFTRLTGHGRSAQALAGPSVADWMADVAEAVAVGRAIGDRVIVMATSTGATFTALAARQGALDGVAGLVLTSPNFRINDPAAGLLTWPWARRFVPLVAGATRGFTPSSAAVAAHWTESYPTVALLPMAAAVQAARAADYAAVTLPALFAFSLADAVVDERETVRVAARWGGPVTLFEVAPGPGIDPGAHVIAGDILSPAGTAPLVSAVLRWAKGL